MRASTAFFGFLSTLIPAHAFPPAPGFTIVGSVRNQFGYLLEADARATLLVERDGAVIARAPIAAGTRLSGNFSVMVPLDTRPADAPQSRAQAPGTTFTLAVDLAGDYRPIARLDLQERLTAGIAGKVTVDLTIAEDLDGDGLPDSWEREQLRLAGINLDGSENDLTLLRPNGDLDGDGMPNRKEFIAGTFAYLQSQSLTLRISPESDSEWTRFETTLVVGKSYRLECSEDLQNWRSVSFADGGISPLSLVLSAANTGATTLRTPSQATSSLTYRLVVD